MEINLYDTDNLITGLERMQIDEAKYQEFKKRCGKTYPFFLSKRYLFYLEKKGNEPEQQYFLHSIATSLKVLERILDIDTGIASVNIQYFDGNGESSHIFGSEIFSKFGVKVLLNYGIRFEERNCEFLLQYLIKSEAIAPIRKMYSKLGWSDTPNGLPFKSGCTISGNSEAGNYAGSMDLMPCGTLEAWTEIVRTEVLSNVPLSVVLLLGFSSPILSYLNRTRDLGSIMFNLSNSSSKGKTTAAMLAASVFSNPIMNRGTMISYNATENALVEFISSCKGHTVVLDEVGISSGKDFLKLMYTICNGRSKMRLNGDSTQKDIKDFSSIIISTAEFDLIHEDMPNGIRTRVFELRDTFTSSAENSDRIKKAVMQNYAVAGKEFIKYLIIKTKSIESDYEDSKSELISHCIKKKELTERIISKLSVLWVTLKYVTDCFSLEFKESSIKKYLIELERQISVEASSEDNLLEIVLQEIVYDNKKYIKDNRLSGGQCFGKILEDICGFTEVQIIDTVFVNLMRKHNINDWKASLRKLKEKNILQTEPDRLYKRITLISELGRQKCYCFRIQPEVLTSEEVRKNLRIATPVLDDSDFLAELDQAANEIF